MALDLELKSDIKVPEAEGGGFGVGACIAAGLGFRANALPLAAGAGRFEI